MKPPEIPLPSNCSFTVSTVTRVTVDDTTVDLSGPMAGLMIALMERRGARVSRTFLASAIQNGEVSFARPSSVDLSEVDFWLECLRRTLEDGGILLGIDDHNPKRGYVLTGLSTATSDVRFVPEKTRVRYHGMAPPLPERPIYPTHSDVPWTHRAEVEMQNEEKQR